MADDSNKVTIVLDLDNKQFVQKTGESKSAFENFSHELSSSASGGMNTALLGIISINQALEVGQKILEAFEQGIKAMDYSESIQNQKTALKNLSSEVGTDYQKLTEAIKRAADGTITGLQATQTATKLLQAGIRAESIPAIVEFAKKTDEASGGQKAFADVINSVALAVDTGAARGLRQYGIVVEATGSRQNTLNQIMTQAELKSKQLGDGYVDTAARVEARMTETGASIKKAFAGAFSKVFGGFFMDELDQANTKLKTLELQLGGINQSAENGAKSVMAWNKATSMNEFMPIAEARKQIEAEILSLKGKISEKVGDEKKKTDELNESLKQERDLVKPLTDDQRMRAELAAKVGGAEAQAAKEFEASGQVSIKTMGQVNAARAQQIDREFALRRQTIESTATSEKVLTAQLIALEEEKIQRVRALRVDDDTFKKAQQQSELNTITENIIFAENAQQRHMQISQQRENESHQRNLEALRNAGLEKEEFNREMENAERQHQQKLSQIKQQYERVNMQNLQFGMNTALNQMRTQFGSFSGFVTSATQKTHSIMSKGFVDLAKGHGDAMEKMLGQFLEMIGTQMIESGTYHLLLGAATFNGAEAGMGAALIGAGMAIVGASAGVSGGGSGGDASVGAPGGSFVTAPGGSAPGAAQPDQRDTKKAQIVINGDYLNSRETANHLAEVIRQNSDTTDFTITAQGRQYG